MKWIFDQDFSFVCDMDNADSHINSNFPFAADIVL